MLVQHCTRGASQWLATWVSSSTARCHWVGAAALTMHRIGAWSTGAAERVGIRPQVRTSRPVLRYPGPGWWRPVAEVCGSWGVPAGRPGV